MDVNFLLPVYEDELPPDKRENIPITYHLVKYVHWALRFFFFFGWMSKDRRVLGLLWVALAIAIVLCAFVGGCALSQLERKLSKTEHKISLGKLSSSKKGLYFPWTLAVFFFFFMLTTARLTI